MGAITKTYKTKKPFDQYVIEYERFLSNPEKFPLSDAADAVIKKSLEIAGYYVQFGFNQGETLKFMERKYPKMNRQTAKAELERAKDVWGLDGAVNKIFEQRRIRRELWILYDRNKDKRPEVAFSCLKKLEEMLPEDPVDKPDVTPLYMYPNFYISNPEILGYSMKEIHEIDRKTQIIKNEWLKKNSHVIEA